MPSTDGSKFWFCRIIDDSAKKVSEWKLDNEAVQQEMITHCRTALPYDQSFEIGRREGYNGVQFFNDQEKYAAFMGKMMHEINGKTELKTDLGRKLEQLVLLNAPAQYKAAALAILTIDFD